jgi:hypothetical protein
MAVEDRIMPMNRKVSFLAVALLLAGCAARTAGSTASPAGAWSGEYGPDTERHEQIKLELRWEASNLRGVVQAGFRELPVTKASFTPETGAITMEFDAQGNNGQTVHYVIEGKVEGNAMSGTWNHDSQRGDFRLTRK